jgi:hypothetical protein
MVSRENDIQTIALLRYADSCPSGELHSDCPFSVDLDAGQRTCNQECRAVITRRLIPGHTLLSNSGIAAFDARQLLLSESGPVPDSHWHTASLLLRLESAASSPPTSVRGGGSLRRSVDITNSLAYLGQRGFDMDAVLRHGLGDRLRSGIILWLSRLQRTRDASERDANTTAWLESFTESVGDVGREGSLGASMAAAMQGGFDDFLSQWISKVPLDSLVSWEFWSPGDLAQQSRAGGDAEAAFWVVDRFTQTYLRQWSESSLECEYRYLQGKGPSGLDDHELGARAVSELTLLREISRRTIEGSTTTKRLEQIKLQAVARLTVGQNEEAAALFDAVRTLEPQNSEAHNNFAFCTLPEDPTVALAALERSEALETTPFPINRINQSLALLLTGNPEGAHRRAQAAYEERGALGSSAWLWNGYSSLTPSDLVLTMCEPLVYLCRLGQHIAAKSSDSSAAELWGRRLGDAL